MQIESPAIMIRPRLAMLILALSGGAGAPAAGRSPPEIRERPHIGCLVNRGAYCVPDMGYSATIYSSDEAPVTILRIAYRSGFSGYGYIVESGNCQSLATRPRQGSHSDNVRFDGETWSADDFHLNGECRLRLLSKSPPQSRGGDTFEYLMAAVRPCIGSRCSENSLARYLRRAAAH